MRERVFELPELTFPGAYTALRQPAGPQQPRSVLTQDLDGVTWAGGGGERGVPAG